MRIFYLPNCANHIAKQPFFKNNNKIVMAKLLYIINLPFDILKITIEAVLENIPDGIEAELLEQDSENVIFHITHSDINDAGLLKLSKSLSDTSTLEAFIANTQESKRSLTPDEWEKAKFIKDQREAILLSVIEYILEQIEITSIKYVTSLSSKKEPRVPTRPADRRRWKATWKHIKGLVKQGKSYVEISKWLTDRHKELACSPDIVADIVRAGEAGVLDNSEQ